MVVLPDLLRVVRSAPAIALTCVILLRLSGCVLPERLRAFCSVLCTCFDGCLEELCARAALLDHLPGSCLDASVVSLQSQKKKE